jgi:UDP-GlcNAc:undecaprenyl-phosphate/decaprenyl-phosphate GlcNAc-1-phosphate transferase
MLTVTRQLIAIPLLCASAIFLVYFLAPFFIRIAHENKLLDYPQGRKKHRKPTPYLGGVVIYLAFWGTIVIFMPVLLVTNILTHQMTLGFILGNDLWVMGGSIFLGSTIMLVTGFLDDVYDLHPLIKLAVQFASAMLLVLSGLEIESIFRWGILAKIITILWIVVILNAFNFIDSMDGHCTGIALISSVTFFVMCQIIFQPLVACFTAIIIGALLGFMKFNARPASIFLGDNGSLFIGYILASITLVCQYQDVSFYGITSLAPLLVFGVPIYDTISVTAVRLSRGAPLWKADRNHFAHRLERLGMSENSSVFFSCFLAMCLGLLAVLTTQISTLLGSFLVMMLFSSIILMVAYLEYYSAKRTSLSISLLHRMRRNRHKDN